MQCLSPGLPILRDPLCNRDACVGIVDGGPQNGVREIKNGGDGTLASDNKREQREWEQKREILGL